MATTEEPGTGDADDTEGADLGDLVRNVVEANAYMVLGSADASGRPWVSPVFFAATGCRDLYWVSSPDVTHSRNIAVRPDVSIVIFDSRAAVGTGAAGAVYMTARATEIPGADLDRTLAAAPSFNRHGGRDFAPADLRPPAPYRLYRATVTEHSVLCPRASGEPCAEHGLRHDHRTRVRLP
jgi:Pyridoxamine 5'-phosphate oxidase